MGLDTASDGGCSSAKTRCCSRKNISDEAEELYHKHGGKIIVIARFIPIVRTFAPIVAGIGTMHYRRFLSYNVVGGFLWATGVVTAGYLLGEAAQGYLMPIIALIIIVSVLPPGSPHFARGIGRPARA